LSPSLAAQASVAKDDDAADARILSAFTICATIWLLLTTAAGLLISFKYSYPDLLTNQFLSFGRLRQVHTTGTFYGWATLALVGLSLWVAARSSGTTIQSRKLAWWSLILFNVADIAGILTLDDGFSTSLEYREWVWPVRVLFLIAALLASQSVTRTVTARRGHDIYISNWYIIGAYIFAAIFIIAELLPFYQTGLGQVAVQGFYMHNAVGMWFTFLALGMMYYVIPKALNRPIYSYALGVLGFWTNLLFYPTIGAHHYEFTPLPWWFQSVAVVFSVGMLVPVWAGSGNLLLTMRGRWSTVRRSYALPFIVVAISAYFLGSTQGTFEALRSLQAIWHLTNFTVGHSHATMYGFITFAAWGGIYALLPRATGKEPNRIAVGVHFWFALIGVTAYVLTLSAAGTEQGLSWVTGQPFIDSVEGAHPYWLGRAVGGTLMFLSHVVFAYNVWRMTLAPADEKVSEKKIALGVPA
jgi:cytochrome c oxidase cbb3-type subunit I